jgi:hypothetical protein
MPPSRTAPEDGMGFGEVIDCAALRGKARENQQKKCGQKRSRVSHITILHMMWTLISRHVESP